MSYHTTTGVSSKAIAAMGICQTCLGMRYTIVTLPPTRTHGATRHKLPCHRCTTLRKLGAYRD